MPIVIFVAALLILLWATLRFYEVFWKRGLTVSVKFDRESVTEGDGFFVVEKIENRKWLPMPAVSLKFAMDKNLVYTEKENTARSDRQYRCDCMALLPYYRVSRRFGATAAHRGYFTVDCVDVVATDLFYRSILSSEEKNETFLYVYPSRSAFPCVWQSYRTIAGEIAVRRFLREDPFAFRGIRAYAPSDPMDRVNQKASARVGELQVNRYYDTTREEAALFLNVEGDGALVYEGLLEEAIRIARSYMEWFIRDGIRVRFFSNGTDKATGRLTEIDGRTGASHTDYYLRQLARLSYDGRICRIGDVFGRCTPHKNQTAILISVSQSDRVCEAFDAYAGKAGSGKMIVPIHPGMEKKTDSPVSAMSRMQNAAVQYLVVGRS